MPPVWFWAALIATTLVYSGLMFCLAHFGAKAIAKNFFIARREGE